MIDLPDDFRDLLLALADAGAEFVVLGGHAVAFHGHCDSNGGLYFDDPSAPRKVILCKQTCDEVSLPGEQLAFSPGCDRISLR
jgi:hypothetical protein